MTSIYEIPEDGLAVAYFSMEFGIDPAMPTYSGGLGILAGDIMRAAADLGLPAVGMTLLHRKGYFSQRLDKDGNQTESDSNWSPEKILGKIPHRVLVNVEGRRVLVQAWRYLVKGNFGHTVPVYFLDTAIQENNPWDQSLTDHLYGGDARYRLCQEVILGWGGLAMLRALGYQKVQAYHMNEGHSSLVALALLEEQTWGRELQNASLEDLEDVEAVRQRCVFTTHTPLAAGHDEFSLELVRQTLGNGRTDFLIRSQCCPNGLLSMTGLALCFSRYINGVSMLHKGISGTIFSNRNIGSITNGVHGATWTSPPFQRLYDHYISEWRRDNLYLRHAVGIPLEEIWGAHTEAKKGLLAEIKRLTRVDLDPSAMTLGFARRATAYKRSDLLFRDLERLKRIARQVGPLQVIYGGKAHPRDESGKNLIRQVFDAAHSLKGIIKVVYLEEYDIALAKYICSGVDLWLNTPQRPQEASGTSGMKAALNGVPSLSVLDGWWVEGHVEGITGWSIGDGWQSDPNPDLEIASLYYKLENIIVPMFYNHRDDFTRIMRSTIAINGSYFNAQRMLVQYLQNSYLRAGTSNVVEDANFKSKR